MMALMADHPELIATPEAHKAFCLLTDDRLRDMYSAAREGQTLAELIANPAVIPPSKLELVTRQIEAKDPRKQLTSMIENLESQRQELAHRDLRKSLSSAGRGNDRELQRELALRAVAEKKGKSHV
jgi:hypothetical protein